MEGSMTYKEKGGESMTGNLLRTKADEILEQGREQGQYETAALFGFLLQNGRSKDAIKASSNRAFLKELLLKFKSGELHAD